MAKKNTTGAFPKLEKNKKVFAAKKNLEHKLQDISQMKVPEGIRKSASGASPGEKYDHRQIEKVWQERWQFTHLNETDILQAKNPYYNLMMFPYPSAEGLHIGNMYAFTGADIYGRFKRMQGYDVFEPIGLDGFGIHSENYALKIGRHPMEHAKITEKNYYNQLARIGAMFDWGRTVETYDPQYYRWTQWIFVQMFKHGLAYRGKANVNWCPGCKTVLADEQVVARRATILRTPAQGRGTKDPTEKLEEGESSLREATREVCERCGSIVEKRLLEQWFFRITAYAEKLLANLERLDWSEKVKIAQQNWIGKREGAEVGWKAEGTDDFVWTFTTRIDTIFGVTFLVVQPQHPVLDNLPISPRAQKYREQATENVSKEQRSADREKTGTDTGIVAIHPFTGEKLPVWVADFVLGEYGTGAVMGVPAHDTRDLAFAKKFHLPIKTVIVPTKKSADADSLTNNDAHAFVSDLSKITLLQERKFVKGRSRGVDPGGVEPPLPDLTDQTPHRRGPTPDQAYTDAGILVNSGKYSGMSSAQAAEAITTDLAAKGLAKKTVTYHLRDWLISRQRYWGPPIPMIYCQVCAKNKKGERIDSPGWWTVPEKDLPVVLPRIDDYQPKGTGVAPLATHREFYEVDCPSCGSKARRETDVSDTFLDSSWYFLRYPSVGYQISNIKYQKDMKKVIGAGSSAHFEMSGEAAPRSGDRTAREMGRATSAPELPWDPQITRRWLPVDMYTGGAEHSVLHLMYSRFITMALSDFGYLDFSGKAGSRFAGDEPFTRFYAHGLLIREGAKMSKSKGNIVNPDEYIDMYGCDSFRLYLMFMGPFSDGGDFQDTAMEGMYRWVGRVWRLIISNIKYQISNRNAEATDEVKRALHRLVKKVTEDIEKRRYNTAIAAMMEFTNLVSEQGNMLATTQLETFLKLLAPVAPFIAEELWSRSTTSSGQQVKNTSQYTFTQSNSIHVQPWPSYDPKYLEEETVTVILQVNGKLRGTITVDTATASDQKKLESLAKEEKNLTRHLKGKRMKNVIFIPGKLVNFVVG